MSNLHETTETRKQRNPLAYVLAVAFGLILGAFVGLVLALGTGLIEITC